MFAYIIIYKYKLPDKPDKTTIPAFRILNDIICVASL